MSARLILAVVAVYVLSQEAWEDTVVVAFVTMALATLLLLDRSVRGRTVGSRTALVVPVLGAVGVYAQQATPERLAYGLVVVALALSVWCVQRGPAATLLDLAVCLLAPAVVAGVLFLAAERVPASAPLLLLGLVPITALTAWRHREFAVPVAVGLMAVPTLAALCFVLRSATGLAVLAVLVAQVTFGVAIARTRAGERTRMTMFVVGEAALGALLCELLSIRLVAAAFAVLAAVKVARGPREDGPVAVSLPDAPPLTERVVPKSLEARGITVRYGGTVAVDDVDLVVRPGRITGLIGPNGAGKTSLIDAVTGFTHAGGGPILLTDDDVSTWSTTRRARAGMGRSFQSLELFEDCDGARQPAGAPRPAGHRRPTSATWSGRSSPPLRGHVVSAIREFQLDEDLDQRRRGPAVRQAAPAGHRPRGRDAAQRAAARRAGGGAERHRDRRAGAPRARLADDWGMAVLLVEHDMNFVMTVCDDIVVLDFGHQISAGHAGARCRATQRSSPPTSASRTTSAARRGSPDHRSARRASPRSGRREHRSCAGASADLSAGYVGQPVIRGLDLDRPARRGRLPARRERRRQDHHPAHARRRAAGHDGLPSRCSTARRPPRCTGGRAAGCPSSPRSGRSSRSLSLARQPAARRRGARVACQRLFPELEARVGAAAGLLSGGEQQMLTLARALARQPSAAARRRAVARPGAAHRRPAASGGAPARTSAAPACSWSSSTPARR